MAVGGAPLEAELLGLSLGDLQVRAGCVHVHGGRQPGLQQLELHDPDAPADVQQAGAFDAFRQQHVDQAPGAALRAVLAVCQQIATRLFGVEVDVVVDGAAVLRHVRSVRLAAEARRILFRCAS